MQTVKLPLLLSQCRKSNNALLCRNFGFNSKTNGCSVIINQHIDTFALSERQIKSQGHHLRWVTTTNSSSTGNAKFTTKSSPPKYDWTRAIREAEQIVAHPTSLLSLHRLLNNENANLALHLPKLLDSNHPLSRTIKNLVSKDKSTAQVWGLIVLLISKAAGYCPSIPDVEQDKSVAILHKQRSLVEITEMIRTSHLIHNSLVNLQKSSQSVQNVANYDDMLIGNKICLLIGDYLLSKSKSELANLRNQDVVRIVLSAVRDFAESEFIGDRDEQNNPLPSNPNKNPAKCNGTSTTPDFDLDENDVLLPMSLSKAMGIPEKEWECRNILNAGSLLGKSCQAALNLAKQNEEIQWKAYLFGKHLSLAWQACLDLEPFQTASLPLDATFNLVSAPVLFHLDYDHKLYEEIEKGKVSIENVDYAKIHREILKGPGMKNTEELQRKHTEAAMQLLANFPANDARTALENIILATQDL